MRVEGKGTNICTSSTGKREIKFIFSFITETVHGNYHRHNARTQKKNDTAYYLSILSSQPVNVNATSISSDEVMRLELFPACLYTIIPRSRLGSVASVQSSLL